MGRGAREGQQTTSFFLPVSSGNKKGPCFLSRGSEGPELSCLLFVWFLQASTYGNNMGFCTAPWSLDSQEWSHWEGGDCSPCDLDNLQFNAQQEEARSPQLRWQPQDALYRAWSLGGHLPTRWPPQPAPKDAGGGGGGGRSQDHEWLCTDFAPSAIAGAGLHLPSTLLPLGCISAHFGAVIPARCTEKGERSRPWSLFELQLGKAPKYLHAQLEMHTYTYRHGSLEVPASRGTPLRGRSWKDTPPHTPRKIPARLSSVPRPPPAPLQTLTPPANLQLPEPTLQDAAHPSPPICSQTQGWGRTGGPRGETVVAGASPTHPLPLSTHSTAASTANRSAFMVGPAEMRRAAGCAQGWRQGRAPGVGKGQRPRPAGRPLPRTAFPHRLPRPRPVSFPRSGEPGPGKGAVSVAPVLASLPPPPPLRGLRATREQSQLSPRPCLKCFFHPPFGSLSNFPEGRDGSRRAACMPDAAHPFPSATPCIHGSLHPEDLLRPCLPPLLHASSFTDPLRTHPTPIHSQPPYTCPCPACANACVQDSLRAWISCIREPPNARDPCMHDPPSACTAPMQDPSR